VGGLYPGLKWLWVDTARSVKTDSNLWTRGTSGQGRTSLQGERQLSEESEPKSPATESQPASSKAYLPVLYSMLDFRSDGSDSQVESSDFMTNHKRETDTSLDKSVERDEKALVVENIKAKQISNSYQSASESRVVKPWDVVYGRCLLYRPVGGADGKISFKYSADHCGYKQYYICEA